jgi:RHS repeat-associated protein
MTFNATPSTQTYTYDQENRLTGAAGYAYTYDGDGNRVRKSSGSTGTLYWYMTPGIVGESDLSGNLTDEYVFFGGERVARKSTNGVFYYFSDHLKTASVITDSVGNIKSESDFYPWGGELQFVNNDSNHYKFTGKERDGETQLDYFGARYYSNGLGRFMTPDKPFADQHVQNPQSWNIYMYVYNNPLRLVDDTGQGARPADDARINQYFQRAENTSIRQAIQATNNYSVGAFEREMSQGSNYLGPKLLGAAGEAVMFNRLADANPMGSVSFQPRIFQNEPDLKVSFEPTMFSDRAALTGIIGQPGGVVPMDQGAATIYFEVKVGSDFSNLMKGATQSADTAAALDPKSNAASVLVVDQDAYNGLSKDQQQQLQTAAGGAYIQVQPNLNWDAAQLAAKTRKEACNAGNDKCK